MLERTQNRLVFHLVCALFIIYRTSSIGMCLNFERNRTTTFGHIAFQINVLSQQSCECSFNYCIPISIFKAIGQLLMGVLHFKDWRTPACGCNCSCSSARRLSKFNSKEPQSRDVGVDNYGVAMTPPPPNSIAKNLRVGT